MRFKQTRLSTADCLTLFPPLSDAVTPVRARASAAAAGGSGGRRSLSQLRLTLQIILSISGGGVTEQLSDHLCNYDRQPVIVVIGGHFIALIA